MSSFDCPHCRFSNVVGDDDWGSEVYCQSCQRLIELPENPAVTVHSAKSVAVGDDARPARSRGSVFEVAGAAAWRERTVAEVACLCGCTIPVTADDVGNTVYCPSCGAGVPVGERLQKVAVATARVATSDDEAPPTSPSAARATASVRSDAAPPRVIFSKGPLIAAAVIAVGAIGAFAMRSTERENDSRAATETATAKDGRGVPGSDGKTAAGKPTGNPEVPSASGSDDAASKSASQTTGEKGAKPEKGETEDNDSPVAQTRADGNDLEVEVTLAMIDSLLGQEDAEKALAQAETWQWILHGQTVSEEDARAVRLKEVIALLVERLTPKPQPPAPSIAIFQKLLAELRQAITDEKLDQARELNRTAAQQFEEHAQDLAPYSRNLAALRSRLKQLERKVDGLRQIEQGLQQAKSLFQQEQVTPALEMKSRAEFAALHHYDMPEADRKRLTQLAAELREPQRLAVGRRAVADAKKCQMEGDRDARDQQMRVALAVLPGLPDSQVRGLIESVNELEKNKGSLKSAQSTALGQRLTARTRYERALELLARGNTSELIAECRVIGRSEGSVSDSEARRWNEQTTEVLFDAVAPLVRDLTEGAIGREQLATEIRAATDALASLESWKTHSRWRALSVELEQFVRHTCREVLSRATKFAAQGNLERAVATWAPFLEVCSSDLKAEADKLHHGWATELELRSSRKAEAEHWSRIQQLAGRESEPAFALARELQTFRQRYPASEQTDEASRIETQSQPRLLADIDRIAALADKAWQAKQWSAFRAAAYELAGWELPRERQKVQQRLRSRQEELASLAEGRLQEARANLKTVVREDDVLRALYLLPAVLELNPDQAEARGLLDKAKAQGATLAADRVRLAQLHLKSEKTRSRAEPLLKVAMQLDPGGHAGQLAGKLLAELRGKPKS